METLRRIGLALRCLVAGVLISGLAIVACGLCAVMALAWGVADAVRALRGDDITIEGPLASLGRHITRLLPR